KGEAPFVEKRGLAPSPRRNVRNKTLRRGACPPFFNIPAPSTTSTVSSFSQVGGGRQTAEDHPTPVVRCAKKKSAATDQRCSPATKFRPANCRISNDFQNSGRKSPSPLSSCAAEFRFLL